MRNFHVNKTEIISSPQVNTVLNGLYIYFRMAQGRSIAICHLPR